MKIAFIGLGVMGSPMAAHLARAGNDVCVFVRHQAADDYRLLIFDHQLAVFAIPGLNSKLVARPDFRINEVGVGAHMPPLRAGRQQGQRQNQAKRGPKDFQHGPSLTASSPNFLEAAGVSREASLLCFHPQWWRLL